MGAHANDDINIQIGKSSFQNLNSISTGNDDAWANFKIVGAYYNEWAFIIIGKYIIPISLFI